MKQQKSIRQPSMVFLLLGLPWWAMPHVQGDASAPGMPPFMRSSELGVSKCSLLGVLGDEDVLLHVWLRVTPTVSCGEEGSVGPCKHFAHVRGFAMLQDVRHSVPFKSPIIQMVQSMHLELFRSKVIYLRSPKTGMLYPLQMLVPPLGRKNVKVHPNTGKLQVTNRVIDIWGNLPLHASDAQMVDLEVRVKGFKWFCNMLVEPGQLRSPTPKAPLFNPLPSAADNQGSAEQTAQPAQPLHVNQVSLTKDTQVWVLLAPYHGLDLVEYSRNLWLHVAWHAQFGVTHYLLYVYEQLGELLEQPLIQALIKQGTLKLVWFEEMSKHEHTFLAPHIHDKYAMQALQYNHAVLALWGTDTLILVLDMDEWLMTSKPMSVVQVFKECVQTDEQLAGLQIRRYDGDCKVGSAQEWCMHNRPLKDLWVGPERNAFGSDAPHPLAHTSFIKEDKDMPWDQKALLDPNRALSVHVHNFWASLGTVSREADRECARLLHLVNFYAVRDEVTDVNMSVGHQRDPWWWPIEALQNHPNLWPEGF